jgi:hypothetical protein
MLKDFFLVRRVGEFAGEVLRGEVELFVHFVAPLGTIGHIVDDAFVGEKLSSAALA